MDGRAHPRARIARLRPARTASVAAVLLLLPSVAADEATVGHPFAVRADALHAALAATAGLALFAHEPNHAGDAYPGARRQPCADPRDDLRGACNDYAAHRWGPLLFADLQARRLGPGPLPAGEGGVALPPDAYVFEASVGRWHDRGHTVTESVYLPMDGGARPECAPTPALQAFVDHATCTYYVPPDGWVGLTLAATHQYRWEGHAPETCVMHNATAVHEHAVCDPYRDGWLADGNDYGSDEFGGGCGAIDDGSRPSVVVAPVGGSWTVAAFVWRDFPSRAADRSSLEDWTGRAQPLLLGARCADGAVRTTDLLVLPLGNHGMPLETRLTVRAAQHPWTALTDVDRYAPFR